MKCKILHETRGRMRVRFCIKRMTVKQADIAEYALSAVIGVTRVQVFDRTCDVVIAYNCDRDKIVQKLSSFSFDDEKNISLVPEQTGRKLNKHYEEKLAAVVIRRGINKLILPQSIRRIIAVIKAARYIFRGLKCLLKGRLEVSVLDATAIGVSLLRNDFKTAGSVMFLLNVGDILDEWTHRKSIDDLARTMSLGVEQVWTKTADGQEVLMSVNEVHKGDMIVVRTGSMIPLDGKVISGDAMVNQSSMTGESVPVHKSEGAYVYAGTVVEDGECTVCVENTAGGGRYDRIVKMIEESEKLKSSAEDKASHLADKLVPWSLGGTLLTWLLTRNAAKALSILMVDFSCALKLAMPISVLSAMRDCSREGITVKGGRFLEAVAEADTIVFDKTGTLTHSSPRVAQVITFGRRDENEMLRLAACLEEHYPHSIANAVVAAAADKGLEHEEFHSKVEYVVAHGISSMVENERVLIGSHHFIIEDEGCTPPDERIFRHLPKEYSHLYLAIGGEVAAVICIEDPLREEAGDVVKKLHEYGISRVVMMTGDNERTAKAVAEKVGVDEYHAEVLPEDKAAFIRAEHEAGRKVVMIGDGVNDSLALSEADAGIAISTGAAIAREIADITISADDLYALVELKRMSNALMKRIGWNYRTIIGFNGGLIGLGVLGVLPPATSALLHNASTLAIGLKSMTELK
ncbi:ATPase, P-type (transporting), HAD superfamily, subfamily IC/heavy metal translocating P-type ATPase [Ruminococcus flavefaciens]|uniref:Cd(2+)-exporting ATPase n=1 Tax=Ruminococcus flavefaciens TaxID=1265 RepID=A0A1H6KKG1_RUMFL|nr:heavy metal translocating P-type ATPase [Ruminococcus flavefaciens]SEH72019.1 ATPase, P-type (transporting), HAD superfamily, subfamily IC/heavy metal translocating P-type ATPase [Ruminococcus flavefaciens]